MGSGWAYYELGWGGWWFWDPVENASFMPWLVGTALIHSLAVTEKRGSFKSWTVLLAIAAFSLSLLGTFLVRSGVLTSVHAFATDPKRGIFILAFLTAVIGSSLLLFAWRAPRVGLGGKFDLISRESLLLSNNVLLTAAAGSVLLGTLYPLIIDALGMGKLSVGPPYFNSVFVPLLAPAIFLMGVGPIARWKQVGLPELAVRLRWALGVSLVASVAMLLWVGRWSILLNLGYFLAFWVFASSFVTLRHRLQATASADSLTGKLAKQSRSYYGMMLAHLGIGVFIIGVTTVKGYETERDVRMDVGDTTTIGSYTFRFNGVEMAQGPNYITGRGNFEVLNKSGEVIRTLHPEKRRYNASGMGMTEAAIDTGFTRDLYVSLGEPIPGSDSAWAVRVYHKPFVDWIWGGCLLMVLGGIWAVSDRRYRIGLRKREASQISDGAVSGMAAESRT